MRKTQEATHFRAVPPPSPGVGGGGDCYEPCSAGAPGAFPATLASLADAGHAAAVLPPRITRPDFDRALLRARATVSPGDLEVHARFTREFGQEG